MELVAGCYEQVLLGFATRPGQSWTVVPDFTHHAHTASLSAVAVNNRYVVTGSRDETIQIYDMKKKIEHGALLQHNGTITSLEFYGTAHLLSGAEDGLICINLIVSQAHMFVGEHKLLFTFSKVLFLFTGITS